MPKNGYHQTSINETAWQDLEEIRANNGLRSVAETIDRLRLHYKENQDDLRKYELNALRTRDLLNFSDSRRTLSQAATTAI